MLLHCIHYLQHQTSGLATSSRVTWHHCKSRQLEGLTRADSRNLKTSTHSGEMCCTNFSKHCWRSISCDRTNCPIVVKPYYCEELRGRTKAAALQVCHKPVQVCHLRPSFRLHCLLLSEHNIEYHACWLPCVSCCELLAISACEPWHGSAICAVLLSIDGHDGPADDVVSLAGQSLRRRGSQGQS